ncbi:hypothetical protein ABZ470_24225 [Streptosporangium sp. NPDC020072]|uniref:glycoside hydrolase family 26 protein n=1 Tax=unclassified Streptosporangium TaxID=2632669 RepID=UPI003328A8E4
MRLFSRKALFAVSGLALVLGTGACAPSEGASRDRPRSTPARADVRPSACAVDAKLVPACGAWWGIAPEIFTGRPPQRAIARAERRMGRRADIVHLYHRGTELFPTPQERRIARDPKGRRILLVNWKPSLDHTWAQIAKGAIDSRIDRLAAHITGSFPERFFLTVHHEPENDVRQRPGSGMTAEDYAAMFRHVVLRLRGDGVRNAVTVMTYMGAPNWGASPWFDRLYPGDDVVDWVAMDPYADERVRNFGDLVDRTREGFARWPGAYRWMNAHLPGKPVMLAEWGVFERPGDPAFKERFFAGARRQVRDYPRIKALVYFDSPHAPRGDTRFDTTPGALQAFSGLAHDPDLRAPAVPQK